MSSWLTKVTVAPGLTVSTGGVNTKLSMLTLASSARASIGGPSDSMSTIAVAASQPISAGCGRLLKLLIIAPLLTRPAKCR